MGYSKDAFFNANMRDIEMNNWEITTLEKSTTRIGDGIHGTPTYASDGDYYFVNGNNLINGHVEIKRDTKRVDFQQYRKHKKELSERTLFVSINGTLGNTAYYRGENIVLGKSACYLNVREDVDLDYIYYTISSARFKSYLEREATGTTIKNASLKQIREYKFLIPDLGLQRKIAHFLKSIDKLIWLNNLTNDYLLESARALYAYWFEDYGYWDGSRPGNWASCTLGDHVNIKRGGSPRPIQDYLSDEGYRWLKISDVTSEPSPYILSIKEHIRPEGINKTVHLNEGALVLSNSATPGIPKILDLDTCIHDGWLYFPSSELSNEWLYLYFMSQRERLVSLANGSVFKNLKIDIVKNFDLVMPDTNTLTSFQKLVQPLFGLMLNCARESRRLAEMRDALLPRLMSGEIDVSQIELPTPPNNHLPLLVVEIKGSSTL